MKEIRQTLHYGTEKMQLILQFPDEPQDIRIIQKEIRAVLITALQEQMKGRDYE